MFDTKLEVDRHVESSLRKINNENERNLRYISFAKLYYKVGEYEQAKRYISSYLSVKPLSAEGQKVLGESLEKLGKLDAALAAYRSSLDLDPKQNNLVIKICELLASDNMNLDLWGARYFCEKAQSLSPNNSAVFSLKEKLIGLESQDPNDVSKFLLGELESRPADVNLRVRLLKNLLQNNQIKEAYKHAVDIEQKNFSVFINSLNWYDTVTEVLIRYQRDNCLNKNLNWEYWIILVSALDKLVNLNLDERAENIKSSPEYVASLFNFDQTLKIAESSLSDCPERQLIQEFLNHYRAQLCFHFVVLIFKQAKKELIKYKDAVNLVLPLLFLGYHTPPADLQCMWLNHCSPSHRQQVQRWHREAAFRCSQLGHIILGLAKEKEFTILERTTQVSSGFWREQLFKKVFLTRDQQSTMKNSSIVSCSHFIEVTIRLPKHGDLLNYDEVAQLVYPDSLHNLIWLCSNNKLPQFQCVCFDGLQYSVKNLSSCAAESLNMLDILSFIYCATLCAESNFEDSKRHIFYNSDKPNILPVAVSENLATPTQTKWLLAAYKMYKNDYNSDFGELRLSLTRGIEVLRCIGNHGLDVKLLVTLAKVFAERAKNLTKHSEVEFNQARAELYWKVALPILEKLKNNQAVVYMQNRLFEYKSKEMTLTEISAHIDDGKLFNGTQLMKKKEHEKALQIFETLKSPYASFYQAQIYKHLADEQMNQNKENVTSEMRSQNIILLSRARDYLYLTLDRLRDPLVDPKHPLNAKLGTEIEKIERLLSRIKPDLCTNRNECDGMSDDNGSSLDSVGERVNLTSAYTPYTSFMNGNATPRQESFNLHAHQFETLARREARPSPERLDAQLRQLTVSKDATINHILEQNKIMVDSHRNLVDELRSFKDAVTNLTSTVNELKEIKHSVDELKTIKTSVDELKTAVDELQNFRDITDMVHEMRKEISDLKKDTTKIKSNQLSDEDLYGLDEEYGNDYNISSNVTGFNPNLYANYQGRMPGPASITYPPPTIYPGMYHMYPYAGLGLPQAGTLPFPQEPQYADFRAITSLSQALNPSVQSTYAQSALTVGAPTLGQAPLVQQQFSQNILAQGALIQPNLLTSQTPNLFKDLPSTVTTFSSGQSIFSTTHSGSFQSSHDLNITSTSKAPPINVVITSSDPLPKTTTTVAPILSVTIPPQHLKSHQTAKSQPHNYQIALPATTTSTFTSPSAITKSPLPISTQNLLANISAPIFSSLSLPETSTKSLGLGLQIEKSLSQGFTVTSTPNNKTDLNKSETSPNPVEEQDAYPDFKPIIPLPDEVPLNTGEENELVMFCERAKLYRYTNKEWRERGIGNLKILCDKNTGKVRILMRRDQIHKICANHFITNDMLLTPMANNDKAYIWAANDFADEEIVLEKLCVRFKAVDEAKKFYDAFEQAKIGLPDSNVAGDTEQKKETIKSPISSKPSDLSVSPTLGGFIFTSPPTFKPKEDIPLINDIVQQETSKQSPFATFTFSAKSNLFSNATSTPESELKPPQSTLQTNFLKKEIDNTVNVEVSSTTNVDTSAHDEDFVPTVDFKPVVPLPELVDVKTGEENEEVLFECRAKLLRFDTSTKEWKERGVGNMKILKQSVIRLLMRREQVHKVCCNHQLLKNMVFSRMQKNPNSLTWCALDFSEGVLKTEMFAIRFKTEEQADDFYRVLTNAQVMLMDENNCVIGEKSKDQMPSDLNINNDNKLKTEAKGEKKSKSNGNEEKKSKADDNENKKKTESSPVQPTSKAGWGDKFKLKSGSWECKTCYIINDGKTNFCVACETPKNNTVATKNSQSCESGAQFSFGVVKSPIVTASAENSGFVFGQTNIQPVASSWGEAFKPKEGSWECKECYVRNDSDKLYCSSCESPKDDTIVKQESKKGIDLDTHGLKFNFGIPPSTTIANTATTSSMATFTFGSQSVKSSIPTTFTFGSAKDSPVDLSGSTRKPFAFSLNESENAKDNDTAETKDQFVFGSPQKYKFEFTPRSPRRQSGGLGGEESDNSYIEDEGDQIYFKPVIPLPDKIEVKTGEEQERVLYCHRAKLYIYVEREWKERGTGDIKILLNPETNKLRIIMRRDQVLKICLNHALTSSINYSLKDDKTYLFFAFDYSEGAVNPQKFCIKFKTSDIAQKFKQAVDDALKLTNDTGDEKLVVNEDSSKKSNDDSDVEFISELTVTAEEEQEAIRLGLPPKFFAYRQLPDCTCDTCKKDDIILEELLKSNVCSPSLDKSNILLSEPKIMNNLTTTSDLSKITFNTPPKDDSPTLRTLLAKPSLTITPKSDLANINSNEIKSTTTISPFLSSLLSSPISSQTSLFATPATNTKENDQKNSTFKTFSFTLNPPSAQPTPVLTSIFGNIISPSTGSNAGINVTSEISTTAKTDTKNIFGPNIFNTPSNINTTPVFGATAVNTQPKFQDPAKSSLPSFANIPNATTPASTEECMLKCDSSLSFASLAAGSPNTAFQTTSNTDEIKPFAFLGAGAPVFGGKTDQALGVPKPNKSKSQSDDESEEVAKDAEEECDPHYEPIVPLPEAIVVSTGEEEETVLFNERAKLFRYDDKEWKERGVGQMKVLHHPVNDTYRLILRREQVHKIVLNQLITADLDMQSMNLSDKAWLWYGYNYVEDELLVEKLAARFKNTELADKFYKTVQGIIVALKEQRNKSLPSTIANYGIDDVSDENHESGDDVRADDEDDDRSVLFMKRCTLSEQQPNGNWKNITMGDLQIYYDPEIYGARISIIDDTGLIVSNTVIGMNTIITVENTQCTWKAVEWTYDIPEWRTLRVKFSSTAAAEEFNLSYLEAVQYANESEIVDGLPSDDHPDIDDY